MSFLTSKSLILFQSFVQEFDLNFKRTKQRKIFEIWNREQVIYSRISCEEPLFPSLHTQNPRVPVPLRMLMNGRSIQGVSSYVLESKRLRSSSGHSVTWRTGASHRVKFLSYRWGRDPWGVRNVCVIFRIYYNGESEVDYGGRKV